MAQSAFSLKLLAAACLVFVAAGAARAADPDGTWTWTVSRNDQSFDLSLDLKHDGETLTGRLNFPNGGGADIKDGTFKDDAVAFSIEFERNGNVRTSKFTGKVDGDTIKGTSESERNGEVRTRDWEAKRAN